MEDEQLQKIAQLLVKNVIEKAVDKIKTEKMEMDEGLDQGVDDIVRLTIGRSINAIREGQSSPTDNKMEGLGGQLDKEVDDIVGLTIGRSINAIREGQSSPTDNKMEGMLKLGLNKTLVTVTPEVTSSTTGNDKPTGLKIGHVTTTDAQMSKGSHKNVLGRLLDRILKRDKKEAKEMNAAAAGGSTNTSVGGKKKSSSKAHNKRDWIRRNLLCCFVRQTATVGPLFD